MKAASKPGARSSTPTGRAGSKAGAQEQRSPRRRASSGRVSLLAEEAHSTQKLSWQALQLPAALPNAALS
jgi:hypothetical protein